MHSIDNSKVVIFYLSVNEHRLNKEIKDEQHTAQRVLNTNIHWVAYIIMATFIVWDNKNCHHWTSYILPTYKVQQ